MVSGYFKSKAKSKNQHGLKPERRNIIKWCNTKPLAVFYVNRYNACFFFQHNSVGVVKLTHD